MAGATGCFALDSPRVMATTYDIIVGAGSSCRTCHVRTRTSRASCCWGSAWPTGCAWS